MSVLSKLFNRIFVPEWSFKYNCYEVGHTWDASCTSSCLEITGVVLDEALRMYGSLSVAQFFLQLFLAQQKRVNERTKEKRLKEIEDANNNEPNTSEPIDEKQQLINKNLKENLNDDKNVDKQALVKLDKPTPSSSQLTDYELVQKIFISSVKSWLRSSAFLGFNAFAMFSLFCFLRQITGKFYYSLVSVIPATLGCLMAIHIEKPNRQSALAIYVANVASEVLFKMGQSRRYYDGFGDTGTAFLFATSLAAVLYRVRVKGYGRDPVSIVIKLLLGRAERPNVKRISSKYLNQPLNNTKQIQPNKQKLDNQIKNDFNNNQLTDKNNNNQIKPLNYKPKSKLAFINWWSELFEPLDFDFKHDLCRHDERSCFLYVFKSTILPFFAGYVGQCVFAIGMKPNRFLKNPSETIKFQFTSKRNLSTAIFLSIFTGGFKGLLCGLRWLTGKSEDWHVAAAGFCAGLSNIYAPNSTLATYVLWKAIECFYVDLYKKGYVPSSRYVAPLLYALSVNTIFYAGILEPYNVRPSYAKFLERITKGRLHLMNRSLLAVFGTNAYVGYEEFWPDLDIKQCSPSFMEDVMVWKLMDK